MAQCDGYSYVMVAHALSFCIGLLLHLFSSGKTPAGSYACEVKTLRILGSPRLVGTPALRVKRTCFVPHNAPPFMGYAAKCAHPCLFQELAMPPLEDT